MITSLIEMLELPNFCQITTSTIWFDSCGKIFDDVMDKIYDVIAFISKYLLRRPRLTNFVDIIEIATMFSKTTFNVKKMLKELEIMY